MRRYYLVLHYPQFVGPIHETTNMLPIQMGIIRATNARKAKEAFREGIKDGLYPKESKILPWKPLK